MFNNHYAAVTLAPNGSLYIATDASPGTIFRLTAQPA